MPFPPSNRVFYGKHPLEEVVCQLRFPPVLRIDTEVPSAFQDRVRTVFPLYQRGAPPVGLGLQLPAEILQAFAGSAAVSHEFLSPDQVWRLSLTRDFLALTTRGYQDWSDFTAKLREPLDALLAVYGPAFFVRVGLRYRDRIDRQRFNVGDVSWKELLRPDALGELADDSIGPHVQHVVRELLVNLTDNAGQVRILHGLQREAQNLTYIIDSDFFTEKQTETQGVSNVLNAFNRRAGHLFRWYVTPRLHDAMEPHDPPG